MVPVPLRSGYDILQEQLKRGMMEPQTQRAKPVFFGQFAKHIRARLLTGILVVIPLWLTYAALTFFFKQLDNVLKPWVAKWFGASFPGLGFVFLIIFVYLIGLIATNIVGRTLIGFGESILNRIPLVKNIYYSSKQLLQTISMSRTMGFEKVIFMEYPRKGLRAVAFVTNTIEDPKTKKKYHTVFIPTTPNPTSGVFEIVPQEDVIDSDMTIEEGIKMVISGGLMIPPQYEHKKKI
jgi:uncharacterized membrane protein